MKFQYIVERIPAAGLVIDDQVTSEWLGFALGSSLRAAGPGPFPVHLMLLRHESSVQMDGTIDVSCGFSCSRCAEDVTEHQTIPIAWSFVEGEEIVDEEDEGADIETWGLEVDREVSFYKGPAIDVEPALIERIVFAMPAYPLCREDCKGLCPKCGQNLNEASCDCERRDVDPRLVKLKTIKLGG